MNDATGEALPRSLIQQPAAPMPGYANPPWDARQKNFERAAEGIRKQDRDIERRFLTKQARRYEDRFRRQQDDFIDLGNNLPEGCKFFWDGHAHMRIRPPTFDGTHRRDTHDGVAQPVAAPNQNAEWL